MKDLNECRKRIDEIDDTLIALFEERMEIATSVADYKIKNNLPIFNKERKKYGEKMLHCLMDLSKDYQRALSDKDKR